MDTLPLLSNVSTCKALFLDPLFSFIDLSSLPAPVLGCFNYYSFISSEI